jgi:cytochrome P450/NADPH-cytochrome P450 reductase
MIGIRLRPGRTTGATPRAAVTTSSAVSAPQPAPRPSVNADGHNTPLMVLFGSNLGTAEGIATRIAQDGSDRGYAVTLGALDDHTGELPHEGALVVVCASYNGKPPDNAERFCRWITNSATPADAGSGLAYSVFGCGNMDWASTYQAVPTLLDAQLEAHGARRVHALARATLVQTSTVSSLSGIPIFGLRWPKAWLSPPSRPRFPRASRGCG